MSLSSWARDDDGAHEPATDAMGVLEGVTTAGAPSTLSLQHLHSLLTTLAPLRASYAAAALDRLRGLPLESRRALLPHVLREHPALLREPRIRAMADELLLDSEAAADRPDLVRWLARVSGVRAESSTEVLARTEHALIGLASGVAEMIRWHRELVGGLVPGVDESALEALPDDALDLLSWTLDPSPDHVAHTDALGRALATLALRSMAVMHAARDAAAEMLGEEDLLALEARAKLPRWWPPPFRDAALWSRAVAEARQRGDRRARYEAAFARAYRAHVGVE